MTEQTAVYRGWHINFSEEGFSCTPVPSFDWPEGIDPDQYDLSQEADWDTPADALRKAKKDIDRWWDDRDAEGPTA